MCSVQCVPNHSMTWWSLFPSLTALSPTSSAPCQANPWMSTTHQWLSQMDMCTENRYHGLGDVQIHFPSPQAGVGGGGRGEGSRMHWTSGMSPGVQLNMRQPCWCRATTVNFRIVWSACIFLLPTELVCVELFHLYAAFNSCSFDHMKYHSHVLLSTPHLHVLICC